MTGKVSVEYVEYCEEDIFKVAELSVQVCALGCTESKREIIFVDLLSRTVRSVDDASQDRIIADHLVEETYKKLFSALDDKLPNQEGRGSKLHKLETESSRLERSKVSIVAIRSDFQDDDGSIRCYHHDSVAPESHDEQRSAVKSLFQRTCKLFCEERRTSRLTCRESGELSNLNDYLDCHQQNLAQRLLQYWNFGTKELFEAAYMEGDCRGISAMNPLLLRNQMGGNAQASNDGCGHQEYCHSAQLSSSSPHLPPPSPPHHHHHHHTHHSLCHHSYQKTKTLLKRKTNAQSAQLSHQLSISTNFGQNKENSLDGEMGENVDPGATTMHQTLGYAIGRRPSRIEGGGIGVYVTKGVVPKGAVVAMYPGTIYYPGEPILLQSIANPFVFRCLDGIHIDGNDKRLSKMIYRSCARRDRLGPYMFSDLSWLTSCPLNPMAVGQYVNNQHKGAPANVCYQEFDVPLDFPLKLRKYIPNAFFGTLPDVGNAGRSMRTVALVSVREIQCGEELLSSYFTLIY